MLLDTNSNNNGYKSTLQTLKRLQIVGPVIATVKLIDDAAQNPELSEESKQALLNEKIRALHRIKCLLDLKSNNYQNFIANVSNPVSIAEFNHLSETVSKMSPSEFKLHIFLILADSLKLNPKITSRLEQEEKETLPKDSVEWLVHALKTSPAVFKEAYSLLDRNTENLVKEAFSTFIHYRHVYLAENNPEVTIQTFPKHPSILFNFWVLNATGVKATKNHNETMGATINSDTLAFFQALNEHIQFSQNPIQISNRIDEQYRLRAEQLTTLRFKWKETAIAQLVCMLYRFDIVSEEALADLTQADVTILLKKHGDSSKLRNIKLTFLPKLLAEIRKANPDLSAKKLLHIACSLLSLISNEIEAQHVVPLFGLSVNKEFCKQARYLPTIRLEKNASLLQLVSHGGFTNLKPTSLLEDALQIAQREDDLLKGYSKMTRLALKAGMATLLIGYNTPTWIPTAFLLLSLPAALSLPKIIQPTACATLTAYTALMFAALGESHIRYPAAIAVLALNLALSAHKIPGFKNQEIISNERFSPNTIPFSLWLNFDKAYATLITLVVFGMQNLPNKKHTQADVESTVLTATLLTVIPTLMLAIKSKVIEFDLSPKRHALTFLTNNLLLVCMAEETTFRLLLQGGLEKVLPAPAALMLASTLFGLAHLKGGAKYAGLATLAGFGYGYAYQSAGLRASVYTHFAFNAIHYLFCSYPMLDPKKKSTVKITEHKETSDNDTQPRAIRALT